MVESRSGIGVGTIPAGVSLRYGTQTRRDGVRFPDETQVTTRE